MESGQPGKTATFRRDQVEVIFTILGVRAVFASRVGSALILVFVGGLLVYSFQIDGFRWSLHNILALVACFCAVRTLVFRRKR